MGWWWGCFCACEGAIVARGESEASMCVIQVTQRYRSDGISHHVLARVRPRGQQNNKAPRNWAGGRGAAEQKRKKRTWRLRVKGFISLVHRELSGLNCGKSIIMCVFVRGGGREGRRGRGREAGWSAVSGTKRLSLIPFSVQTVLVLKVIILRAGPLVLRSAAAKPIRSGNKAKQRGAVCFGVKRQTGKEATRFFHSAGLRDSSRLIVIMCGAQTGNQFRSAKQGKNGSSWPCVLSLYFGSLDFVVVVVRLLFLCFFSMSFVRRLCVCVLCV